MIIDFESHNEEQARVWEAYRSGRPIRPPMVLGVNPRYTMPRPDANPTGIDFLQYTTDALSMLQRQCEHIWWVRHNLMQDGEMGPSFDGFHAYVDLQNYYEAAWFGAEVVYERGQVPDTLPLLSDEDKSSLIDGGIPDPFSGGAMGQMWEMREQMLRLAQAGFEYMGKPVLSVSPSGMGTDGPMTVCCNLRGAENFCADLAGEPNYAQELLSFVMEATIARILAYREAVGQADVPHGLGFADDSIQLISTRMYEEQILPHHRRLIDGLSGGGPNSIHLCGDATRHFPLIAEKLNVTSFDTGFPVDFKWLGNELPKTVEVLGGPSVPFLEHARPGEVRNEVERILSTGIARGRRFILREGNNLAPEVSPETVARMYDAVRDIGHLFV